MTTISVVVPTSLDSSGGGVEAGETGADDHHTVLFPLAPSLFLLPSPWWLPVRDPVPGTAPRPGSGNSLASMVALWRWPVGAPAGRARRQWVSRTRLSCSWSAGLVARGDEGDEDVVDDLAQDVVRQRAWSVIIISRRGTGRRG